MWLLIKQIKKMRDSPNSFLVAQIPVNVNSIQAIHTGPSRANSLLSHSLRIHKPLLLPVVVQRYRQLPILLLGYTHTGSVDFSEQQLPADVHAGYKAQPNAFLSVWSKTPCANVDPFFCRWDIFQTLSTSDQVCVLDVNFSPNTFDVHPLNNENVKVQKLGTSNVIWNMYNKYFLNFKEILGKSRHHL